MYLVHWPMFLAEDTPPGFPPPVESRLGYDEDAFLAVWRELEAAVRVGAAQCFLPSRRYRTHAASSSLAQFGSAGL